MIVLTLIPLVICFAIMAKVGFQSEGADVLVDASTHQLQRQKQTEVSPSDTLGLIQGGQEPASSTVEVPSGTVQLRQPSSNERWNEVSDLPALPPLKEPTEIEAREELLRFGLSSCAWDIYNEEYSKRQLQSLPPAGEQRRNNDQNASTMAGPTMGPGSAHGALPNSIPQAGIDHVYMIHYSPLKKRRALMTNLLAAHGVAAEWFLGFDKDQLNSTMVDCLHKRWTPEQASGGSGNDRTYARKAKAKRHVEIPARPVLKPSQQSVVIKHHAALYDMVRHGYRTALILEDDAFLRVNFVERLSEVMSAVKAENGKSAQVSNGTESSWLRRFVGCDVAGTDCPSASEKPPIDVIMIGGCMRMFGWRRKYRTVQLSKHLFEKQEARCAHAFVVTLQGAKALLASIPLTLPIDFQITRAMVEWNLRAVWVEPYLSVQGDTGECVTNDLGAGCVSVEKGIDLRPFDIRFLKDPKINAMWDFVPEHNSRK